MRRKLLLVLILLLLCSCKKTDSEQISHLVKEWSGKEILFSPKLRFSLLGKETKSLLQDKWDYAIVSYTDSISCMSCELQLNSWKDLIKTKDSLFHKNVVFLFFIHPYNRASLIELLEQYNFDYPICIDDGNVFSKLNNLSSNKVSHTFLLNRNGKIVAIGNPVLNPKVKKLYGDIIQGENVYSNNKNRKTEVNMKNRNFPLGIFGWQQEKSAKFVLENTGDQPLVIDDVVTSCGCVTVDYLKEPVRPNDTISLFVTYKAEQPGHFDKTIKVYCNAESSPVLLKITGDAR